MAEELAARPKAQRFRWARGLTATGPALVGLLALNLWQHRPAANAELDSSPFAEAWQLCGTIAYGWPARAVWVQTGLDIPGDCESSRNCRPGPCSELPYIDPLGVPFDLGVAGVLLLLTLKIFGGWRASMRIVRFGSEELQ